MIIICATVFATIVYRIQIDFLLKKTSAKTYSSIIITVTSAVMNLICSILLSKFFYWIAKKLTNRGKVIGSEKKCQVIERLFRNASVSIDLWRFLHNQDLSVWIRRFLRFAVLRGFFQRTVRISDTTLFDDWKSLFRFLEYPTKYGDGNPQDFTEQVMIVGKRILWMREIRVLVRSSRLFGGTIHPVVDW